MPVKHIVNRPWMVFLALILSMSFASGLGIGPVQKYVVFEPGLSENLSLYVFNNDNRDITFDISTRGELSDYIALENNRYSLAEDQASLRVGYMLSLPQDLSPGQHAADIVVTEAARGQGTVIAAQSQVSRLIVQVPYPGYYAQAKMIITPGQDGADFEVQVYNYGASDIMASAVIDIYSGNTLLQSVDAGSSDISSMEQKKLGRRCQAIAGRLSCSRACPVQWRDNRAQQHFPGG